MRRPLVLKTQTPSNYCATTTTTNNNNNNNNNNNKKHNNSASDAQVHTLVDSFRMRIRAPDATHPLAESDGPLLGTCFREITVDATVFADLDSSSGPKKGFHVA